MTAEPRTWAGRTLSDRRDERRRRLLDAGIDLLGGADGEVIGVRSVCRRAKLTERYFYESFADRDALVMAVYDDVAAQAHQVLVDAVTAAPDRRALAEAAVTAFVDLILDDPRKGRVLLLAPMTDASLFGRGIELVPGFAALVKAQLPAGVDEPERAMAAIGQVGALTHLFIAHLDGTLVVPRERLVAHCVRQLLRAGT
ncbi:TetR/AcrR family transcriptional regulator [Pseudonocardia sp. GCM10023141]|uniref:TetR/AcrR family transcriptional regulator n=1 Tax=Pseudonocardia sp. GCM10023141 TaxID=3252653 RepID=UPI003616C373